jgi:elongator complex protein 1
LGNLLRALVPFEYVEEARAIQEKFEKFLKEMKTAAETVFVPLQLAVSQVMNQIYFTLNRN